MLVVLGTESVNPAVFDFRDIAL